MNTLKQLIKPIICGLGLYAIFFMIFHPFVVSGNSMNPTFKDQDVIFSTTDFSENDLNYGDIVVCKAQNTRVIKRIIALPGDTVHIKNGILYVNGLPSEYNFDEPIQNAGCFSDEQSVKDHHYVIMGDNRNHSDDSRSYGAVDIDSIRYVVTDKLF